MYMSKMYCQFQNSFLSVLLTREKCTNFGPNVELGCAKPKEIFLCISLQLPQTKITILHYIHTHTVHVSHKVILWYMHVYVKCMYVHIYMDFA